MTISKAAEVPKTYHAEWRSSIFRIAPVIFGSGSSPLSSMSKVTPDSSELRSGKRIRRFR